MRLYKGFAIANHRSPGSGQRIGFRFQGHWRDITHGVRRYRLPTRNSEEPFRPQSARGAQGLWGVQLGGRIFKRLVSSNGEERARIRASVLSAALGFGLATSAGAALSPAPLGGGDPAIVKVAEGCGAGWRRGPGGYRHRPPPYDGGLRGARFACPPGMQVGPYGHRCWPS